jgi:hypothetical protein
VRSHETVPRALQHCRAPAAIRAADQKRCVYSMTYCTYMLGNENALLEACVCAVLQVLVRARSVRSCRALAPKVQTGREARLSKSAPTPYGSGSRGVPRTPLHVSAPDV